MRRKIYVHLLTIGLLFGFFHAGTARLLAQASGAKAAPQKQAAPNSQASASAALDRQIEAQIHERLAKSKIGQDKITARVENGIIYLDGTTTVSQHKGAATRMAKSIMNKNPGVKRVVNNIKVSKLGSSPVTHATVSKPSKSFSEAPAWTPPKSASPPSSAASGTASAPGSAKSPATPTATPPTPSTQAQATPAPATPPVPADLPNGPRKVAVQWK